MFNANSLLPNSWGFHPLFPSFRTNFGKNSPSCALLCHAKCLFPVSMPPTRLVHSHNTQTYTCGRDNTMCQKWMETLEAAVTDQWKIDLHDFPCGFESWMSVLLWNEVQFSLVFIVYLPFWCINLRLFQTEALRMTQIGLKMSMQRTLCWKTNVHSKKEEKKILSASLWR